MENVTLNNGIVMPMVGFGTYQITENTTLLNVDKAFRLGYRLIDTAQYYGNEEGVGEAVKESGLPREKVFVTTKVQTTGYEETIKGLDQSLKNFNQDYFDMVLIHWPTGDDLNTYRALETAYKDGKVRSIGLSNFNIPQVQEILDNTTIKPVVDQIETHILWQQERMHKFLTGNQIIHESYAPLGEGNPGFLDIPVLEEIGKKYQKTPAQVTLRYFVQNGIVVIPKSTNTKHMEENINIFDFKLNGEEMAKLRDLDVKQSIDGWPTSMQEQNY
ncbi:aldo/keto reductase [Lactobacillaceae bacterium 24-114]